MQVDFKFKPREKVQVVAYGLHCDATILRCVWDGIINYDTEYVINGEIKRGEFFEEQLA